LVGRRVALWEMEGVEKRKEKEEEEERVAD
jgi:hypothetical protein